MSPREPFAGGKGKSYSRVKMGAGEVADGVNHDHHVHSPQHCRHRKRQIFVGQLRRKTGKQQQISPHKLRYQLHAYTHTHTYLIN